ncbi:MAG: hypothetical protein M1832_006139 [Thelocarpon impressellum]|nr:MAG: hypothetical protein M1832_006139 [Thelocarpon impressellum]
MFLTSPPPSVLPPPRYPSSTGQAGGPPTGAVLPVLETSNQLNRPAGQGQQLLVGEGTYILRDDLHLASPPPHPSEAPIPSLNPLATTVSPPVAGTKLSLVTIAPPKYSPRLYHASAGSSTLLGSLQQQSLKEDPREARSSGDSERPGRHSDESGGVAASPGRAPSNGVFDQGRTPGFGESNASLTASQVKEGPKRRKPKSNLVKSNSSFVSRVILHDMLSKRLQEHAADGLFAFANIKRSFQWLDLSSPTKSENLTKILFTKAHALCHDVNQLTKSSSHLDVIIGFSCGDVIWYEPMSQKYARLNKNGAINGSAVSDIRWIPGSESLFLAAHADGSLVVYDKEKDDAAFAPEEAEDGPAASAPDGSLRVDKSVNSKNQKANPVASWKLSSQRINAFAFSPDCKHLAVVSEDGSLHVLDYLAERLLDSYSSYYGGLICVCWSPDGRYVLTGGQDDLVSIWSLDESRIVARCQGHHSWVTAVAFDRWRCDERNYRFGSVGEDCRLLLWDFGEGMLHRPKAASVRQRGSVASHFAGPPASRNRPESQGTNRPRSSSNVTSGTMDGEGGAAVRHAAEPRALTAKLQPVLSKQVGSSPLSWLDFREDCIITSCSEGHVRTWDRPANDGNESQATISGSGSNA